MTNTKNQPPQVNAPSFNRRRFLGGGTAIVALPFMESLLPRAARAQAASMPKRLLFY
jgi:hypothetical protein